MRPGSRRSAVRTRSLGFVGKLAIHPAQVGVIQRAYRPTAEQVARAQKIVAAYDAAGGNVANVDGQMIRRAHLPLRVQRVLQRGNQLSLWPLIFANYPGLISESQFRFLLGARTMLISACNSLAKISG